MLSLKVICSLVVASRQVQYLCKRHAGLSTKGAASRSPRIPIADYLGKAGPSNGLDASYARAGGYPHFRVCVLRIF